MYTAAEPSKSQCALGDAAGHGIPPAVGPFAGVAHPQPTAAVDRHVDPGAYAPIEC